MLLLYKLRRLKYDIVLILMISTAHLICVQSHVCMFVKRPDPSRPGGTLRWSLPKVDICRCQRVAMAHVKSACPSRNEYKAEDLWFVDDPQPLTKPSNWGKDKLDELLPRTEFCDPVAPSFDTCHGDFEIQTDMGKPTGMVLYITPSASDNSGYVSVMCEPSSGSDIHIGQNRITCEALDNNENSAICEFIVYVRDLENPLFTNCPGSYQVQTDPGNSTAVVVYQPPIATDNSGEVTVACAPLSESELAMGQNSIACVAKDGSENYATCTFIVDVKDEENPSISTCPADVEIQTDPGNSTTVVTFQLPTVSDNSGKVPIVTCDPLSETEFAMGQTSVTCTAQDDNGNAATCEFVVDVQDEEDPLISACPADIETQTDPSNGTAVVAYQEPTATDNSGEVIVTCAPPSDSEFAIGKMNVTCVATDSSGNIATCAFTVDVGGITGCTTGWPVVNRATINSPGWTMVSPDKQLCSGQVTKWTYLGKYSWPFRAIVFRPVSGSQFQIVGINDIPAGAVNVPVEYYVPEVERIIVAEGDVIGWSFGEAVIALDTNTGSAIVRYIAGYLHSVLQAGQTLSITNTEKKAYSIEATVELPDTNT